MRRRPWIAILAVFSVLLHATAIARHHSTMLGAAGGHAQLIADLGVICSPSLSKEATPAGQPELPAGGQGASDCPVCLGQVAASAVLAVSTTLAGNDCPGWQLRWPDAQSIARAFEPDWPLGTGPPSLT